MDLQQSGPDRKEGQKGWSVRRGGTHLDNHSCNSNQANEQQHPQPSFVELLQQEELGPADLGLAVGRVPELVDALPL